MFGHLKLQMQTHDPISNYIEKLPNFGYSAKEIPIYSTSTRTF